MLAETERRAARERAHRYMLRRTPEADLLAELNERVNWLARYQADLDAGEFRDGDADRLRGGIALERDHIEAIVTELEARERARAYGYRTEEAEPESDLPARFEAARLIESADVIRVLIGRPGAHRGQTEVFVCPFHGDGQERTPSLTAYPGDRGWYCFGCGRGGDAVRFVMEWHAVGAVEALLLLEAGVLGEQVLA